VLGKLYQSSGNDIQELGCFGLFEQSHKKGWWKGTRMLARYYAEGFG
jgi:hypothetical protein